MAAIHIDSGVGQVFGPVQTFAVDIGIEMTEFFNLLIKVGIYIAIEDIGTVKDIGRAGYFNGRI